VTLEERTWCRDAVVGLRSIFVRVCRQFSVRSGLRSELDGEQVIRKEWMSTPRHILIFGDLQRILQLADPLTHRHDVLMKFSRVG